MSKETYFAGGKKDFYSFTLQHNILTVPQQLHFLTSTYTVPSLLRSHTPSHSHAHTPSQVAADKKVKSDGCIAADQIVTDKPSQRQNDCPITVMYLNVCMRVCVCVRRVVGVGVRVLAWPLVWINSQAFIAGRWQTWAWLQHRISTTSVHWQTLMAVRRPPPAPPVPHQWWERQVLCRFLVSLAKLRLKKEVTVI